MVKIFVTPERVRAVLICCGIPCVWSMFVVGVCYEYAELFDRDWVIVVCVLMNVLA